jgi:hypothetical protein
LITLFGHPQCLDVRVTLDELAADALEDMVRAGRNNNVLI